MLHGRSRAARDEAKEVLNTARDFPDAHTCTLTYCQTVDFPWKNRPLEAVSFPLGYSGLSVFCTR